MAFPTRGAFLKATNGTTASATPAVSLPDSGILAGDLLIVLFRCALPGAIGWPAEWNELFDASSDGADDQMALAYKVAQGDESGTSITLSSGNGKFAAISAAIRGAANPLINPPQLSTVAIGTNNAPNATTVTPTGGAKDYMWITFFGQEGENTITPTAPTNYQTADNSRFANSGVAGAVATNCHVGMAIRDNLNAASEDAGAFASNVTDDWTAYTLAIHPVEPSNSHILRPDSWGQKARLRR